MGKEQELLEAARSGNLSVVERILSQRARKTGPLASLRRGPGANTQDQSGYTSLHHSALNGHKDIVQLLLAHEASTNVVDNKGSTPLHLAAWTGNTEIVKLLLIHGPSVPNVNLANHDHETPLHSAAQYGHGDVVALLLTHNSDPTVRNLKEESPLDLAAQYGRLDAVELLIKAQPQMLQENVRKHSPLHLASRNGHKQVVKVLLDEGFDVNFTTDGGSGLHEAALYGKVEVVKLLLEYNIDVNLENFQMKTVFDLLEDLNTAIAKQIWRIIKEHATLVSTDDDITESPNSLSPPPGFMSSGHYANVLLPERYRISQPIPINSPASDISFYEVPHPLKSLNSSTRSSGASDFYRTPTPSHSRESSFDQSSPCSRSPSIYDNSTSVRDADSISLGSSYQSPPPQYDNLIMPVRPSRSCDADSILYEVPPPPPRDSTSSNGKRFSDPLHHGTSYQNVPSLKTNEKDLRHDQRSIPTWSGPGSYIQMAPLQTHSIKPQPPAKPPRRSVVPLSPDSKMRQHGTSYEFLCLASSLHHSPSSGSFMPVEARTPPERVVRRQPASSMLPANNEYVDMKLRTSLVGPYENHMMFMGNSFDQARLDRAERLDASKSTHWTHTSNGRISDTTFTALYDDLTSGRKIGYNTLMTSKSTPALHAARHMLDHVVPVGIKDELATKPNTLDLRPKRATVQIPLSPTNYNQPPTPDFPPPSPSTAESGIEERIRPLSQEEEIGIEKICNLEKQNIETTDHPEHENELTENPEYRSKKRNSRDIETLTEEQLVATVDASGEVHLLLGKENKSVATDIEEFVTEDPFAGLCRGSTSSFDKNIPYLKIPLCPPVPSERKIPRQRNTYENVGIEMENSGCNRVILQSSSDAKNERRSSLSVMSPFDENAEWDEINNIMASFGSGIARESVFAREIEARFADAFIAASKESQLTEEQERHSSVEDWLSSIGLSQYENLLIIEGYDDIRFLGGNVLDDQDLQEIGIHNSDHRKRLIAAAQRLPILLPVCRSKDKTVCPQSVDEWLEYLNLEEYKDVFKKNEITNMDRARKLWEVELNTVLNITKVGHRKRILASFGEMSVDRFFDVTNADELDLSQLDQRLSEFGIDDEVLEQNPDIPEYGAVKPKQILYSTLAVIDNREGGLRIRPPTQLMTEPGASEDESPQHKSAGSTSPVTAQWRHDSEVLIEGCCNYRAQYLGSTLVKELQGMESTRKSIQKLKTSTRDIGKIPNVVLSISYTGVKFIDAHTQQLVCEHEIRNIHCACQDADDLNHFAYITKEHQTLNHFCHVFCAQTMDLATEIILTLGQAFEVAYQLALQEKTGSASNKPTVNINADQRMSGKGAVMANNVQLVHMTPESMNSFPLMLSTEKTKL